MSHYVDSMLVEGLHTHKSWNTNTLITTVSASTLTLTVDSETMQVFQGSTAGQIVKMPDCTTFAQVGQRYALHNDSTVNLTVQDNASGVLFLLGPNHRAYMICAGIGSAAGVWTYFIVNKTPDVQEQFLVTYPGAGLTVNHTGGNAHFNGTIYNVAGGAIALTNSVTNGWIYVDIDGAVKQAATLPVNTLPLYMFTTAGGAVTALVDEREDFEQNLVWGVLADISANTYNNTKYEGALEKYARADHRHGGLGILIKSGSVAAGSFSGNPKTYAFTFAGASLTNMPSTNYTVTITGTDGRSWVVTNIATTGFTISAQANAALTGPVYWHTILIGESV